MTRTPATQQHQMTRREKVVTRPNTGTSGYEMDLQELREKYDRVSDEEQATAVVQHAWSQASQAKPPYVRRAGPARVMMGGWLFGSAMSRQQWYQLWSTYLACGGFCFLEVLWSRFVLLFFRGRFVFFVLTNLWRFDENLPFCPVVFCGLVFFYVPTLIDLWCLDDNLPIYLPAHTAGVRLFGWRGLPRLEEGHPRTTVRLRASALGRPREDRRRLPRGDDQSRGGAQGK